MFVKDLTVEEFEKLMRRIIADMIDPDDGLELQDEVKEYLETHKDDQSGISHEEVKRRIESKLNVVS
ncbi:MAG: hypothetical protein HQL02_02055 [Nitrospirae bacterium]|nr:hypothetical protein [Nitrospirota bacterium]